VTVPTGTGASADEETEVRGDLQSPDVRGDEKTTLLAFLDYLRDAVVAKVVGVPDQLARRPGVESATSLLWLVKHLTAVELNWFTWAYAGVGADLWDEAAPIADGESVHEVLNDYRDAITGINKIAVACKDLHRPGARSTRETPPPSMRWILVHMIEETARHAGHADILREQIDGTTGR
jgi:hypothetical protein